MRYTKSVICPMAMVDSAVNGIVMGENKHRTPLGPVVLVNVTTCPVAAGQILVTCILGRENVEHPDL